MERMTRILKECEIFSLCDVDSIGKTEIATEYMLSKETKFDALFWLQAVEPTELREAFSEITIDLALADAIDATDPFAGTKLVKEWLAELLKYPYVSSWAPRKLSGC